MRWKANSRPTNPINPPTSLTRFLVMPNKGIEQEFRMIKWKPTKITILSIVTMILLASCGSLNSFPSDIQNAVQTSIPTLPSVVAKGYPVPNVPTSTVEQGIGQVRRLFQPVQSQRISQVQLLFRR